MRFRAVLAILLTAFLLTTSLAASNCEAQCDLQASLGHCHAAKTPDVGQSAAQHSMADMDGMKTDRAGGHDADKPRLEVQGSDCGYHACSFPIAAATDQKWVLTHKHVHVGPLHFVAARASRGSFVASTPLRGPPRLRNRTPVLLHTLLRV